MFNLFARKKNGTQKALTENSILGFAAGLEAGIAMVRIAAKRNEALKQGYSLDHVANVMQETLDEFKADHGCQFTE